MKKIFKLKGLDCPHCGAKIEKAAGSLDGVAAAAVNLINQTLTIETDGNYSGDIFAEVEKIVHTHEPDVEVSAYETRVKTSNEVSSAKREVIQLSIGAAVYGAGLVLTHFTSLHKYIILAVLAAAYIILGGSVVIRAVKNILKGRIFDENFLMTVSTIGAFAIGEYPEAVAVMLFYQIGEFFQDMAVKRSRGSISALMDIRPDSANVQRNGHIQTVSPEEVRIGEIIIVKPGEKIPLDGIVTDGVSMIDTSALTGESVPRSVKKDDEVLSGCVNGSGVLMIEVKKEFHNSTASKIIDLVENAASRKAPAENFITTFARYYTPVVVVLAVILAVVPPLLFGEQWTDWIRRGFVFLVISCPCALVISIPLTFFGGIGRASRKGVLVKGGNYLEALNKVDTIVFDKTGTLTQGVFDVVRIAAANGFTDKEILQYASKAESLSTHPIARSIERASGEKSDNSGLTGYKEISGHGIAVTDGDTEIAVGNEKLMRRFEITYESCDDPGTKVYVGVNKKYAGCIIISDKIKDDSQKVIAELKSIGIKKTVMLTGDSEQIAASVAGAVGIDEYYAELLPDQKVEKLEQLDNMKSGKIAFVGDGINDAPVLARADVGIAMGGLGSDAAIEAADVVLMTDEVSKLCDAIKTARYTKRIIMQNIVFALGIKGAFLLLGAFGVAGMWTAVFGDVGVMIIAVLNAMRILKK